MWLMRWRKALGALLGMLLPLPLVLLLGSVMYPGLRANGPEAARFSPVLDGEERARRVTYRRECARKEDCEPPLGCLLDASRGRRYCTDSQCRTNEECREDEECRPLVTFGGGPLVRFCIPLGRRTEGQHCIKVPGDKSQACQPGLVCAGMDGFCARSCQRGEPTSCPDGFLCADVAPAPVCLPTCEARGCPSGQECVRYDGGASVCEVVFGPQCQKTPCPDGRRCDVIPASAHPGNAWSECVIRCGKKRPACPEGFACNRWHCLPSCKPGELHACAEGYRCEQEDETSPWVCQPDW